MYVCVCVGVPACVRMHVFWTNNAKRHIFERRRVFVRVCLSACLRACVHATVH